MTIVTLITFYYLLPACVKSFLSFFFFFSTVSSVLLSMKLRMSCFPRHVTWFWEGGEAVTQP